MTGQRGSLASLHTEGEKTFLQEKAEVESAWRHYGSWIGLMKDGAGEGNYQLPIAN